MSPDNSILRSIDKFLSKPSGAEPDAVLKALSKVKFSGARPQWQEWLKSWTNRLGKSEEAEKPKEAAKANKA
jgi:hypothetical protein